MQQEKIIFYVSSLKYFLILIPFFEFLLLQAQTEPEQCVQRLICDIATGQMPESDNDIIPTLFKGNSEAGSSKFNYFMAAQLGKAAKNIKSCELRFSCSVPLDQVFQWTSLPFIISMNWWSNCVQVCFKTAAVCHSFVPYVFFKTKQKYELVLYFTPKEGVEKSRIYCYSCGKLRLNVFFFVIADVFTCIEQYTILNVINVP